MPAVLNSNLCRRLFFCMVKIMPKSNFKSHSGFTLIEMAIVLVVIGLILGMVYKGRQIIASAKVKHNYAAYNKIIAGMNTFYDRYGFYPGDGCENDNELQPYQCNGNQNGMIGNGANDANGEYTSFWSLLVNGTNILSAADRKSSSGNDFFLHTWYSGAPSAATDKTFLVSRHTDIRLACNLDQIADDGNSNTGSIATKDGLAGTQEYDATTEDCWEKTGQVDSLMQLLP